MSETTADRREESTIDPGTVVYTAGGDVLGVVSGFTREGFTVEGPRSSGAVDGEHRPGQAFGEGYLTWRCADCGEVGDLDDEFPTECPSCSADRTALFLVEED